jgi:hypothetical protein
VFPSERNRKEKMKLMKERENAFFLALSVLVYPAGLPLIERGATHARRVFKRSHVFLF